MEKKPIICNVQKWKDFNKKQLTLLKMCVTSLLCGPQADLWPFYGFLCRWFSLYKGLPRLGTPGKRPHWSTEGKRPLNSALPLKDSETTHTRGGRQSLAPVDINTQERKQLEQETVSHPEFKPRFSQWLQTGMVAEICDLWFALSAKASWSKITNGKDNYRVLLRRNLEAIGAVGANLRQLSFSGSVELLRWSAQPW